MAQQIHTAYASTGADPLDITTAKFGGSTPKAIIVGATYCTTITSKNANASAGIGFATGSGSGGEAGVSGCAQDNQATTATRRGCITGPVCLDNPAGPAYYDQYAFNSWIANGIRLNRTSSSGADIPVMMFEGSDVSAQAGKLNTNSTTQNNTFDVTSVGFEPDIVFFAGIDRDIPNSSGIGCIISTGVALNAPTILNHALMYASRTTVATSETGGVLYDNRYHVSGNYSAVSYTLEVTSFLSNGFRTTVRDGNTGTDEVAFLALKFNNLTCKVGIIDSPVSTGSQFHNLGVTPDAVVLIPSWHDSVNTLRNDSRAGVFGMCLADDTDQYSACIHDEDNVGTTNAESLTDTKILNVMDDSDTNRITATLTSFGSNGMTLNYSAVDSTARKIIYAAFGTGDSRKPDFMPFFMRGGFH